jgi:hypothetical protein
MLSHPHLINKPKESPMNRPLASLGTRNLTGCPSKVENPVILFSGVATDKPTRRSHLLPAVLSSPESATASFGSKAEA